MASRKNNLQRVLARTNASIEAKKQNELQKRMKETAKQRARALTLSQVKL